MISTGQDLSNGTVEKWSNANKDPTVIRIIGPRMARIRYGLSFTGHLRGAGRRRYLSRSGNTRVEQVDSQRDQEHRPIPENLVQTDQVQIHKQKHDSNYDQQDRNHREARGMVLHRHDARELIHNLYLL